MTRNFHIGDVLSITTGRLVSNRHMDGIYDILKFMTGEDIFTHQIPRVMKECQPWLLAQYPALSEAVLAPSLDIALEGIPQERKAIAAGIATWLRVIAEQFTAGVEMLPVEPLAPAMHTRIDPIEEARARFGDDNVITVGVD